MEDLALNRTYWHELAPIKGIRKEDVEKIDLVYKTVEPYFPPEFPEKDRYDPFVYCRITVVLTEEGNKKYLVYKNQPDQTCKFKS